MGDESIPGLDEKRKHPRRTVCVRVEAAGADQIVTAWTRDISRGGLCLSSRRRFEKGDSLAMTLFVPDQPPIEVGGQVVWVTQESKTSDYLLGLSFTVVTDEEQRTLFAYVDGEPATR